MGCDARVDHFGANKLYGLVVARRDAVDSAPDQASIATVVGDLFGTPNEPQVPDFASRLLDREKLVRAAGPISSDQAGNHFGLYREHCATCHGIEGGGAGPAAALLNPYPRDFRHGVFKFKSTHRADKPTAADLQRVLRRGIPGTAMPSFATIGDDDLEALVQYVVYLSLRGQTERKLIDRWSAGDLNDDELVAAAGEIAADVVAAWESAAGQIVDVPPLPSLAGDGALWWQDSDRIERGRELFHGPLANCASCHGKGGDGEAVTLDFDDWTKEYTTKLGIGPADSAALEPLRSAGALRPRQLVPRKLAWNVFHGDNSDEGLYRRLVVGIAGSPMPGLLVNEKPGGVGVEPDDVWSIIAYIRSL